MNFLGAEEDVIIISAVADDVDDDNDDGRVYKWRCRD